MAYIKLEYIVIHYNITLLTLYVQIFSAEHINVSDMLQEVEILPTVKLRLAHAPGMLGTFSPPLRVSDPDMHHSRCVAHVP